METIMNEWFWYLIGLVFVFALGYFCGLYHGDHMTRKVIAESNIKSAQRWEQKEAGSAKSNSLRLG